MHDFHPNENIHSEGGVRIHCDVKSNFRLRIKRLHYLLPYQMKTCY